LQRLAALLRPAQSLSDLLQLPPRPALSIEKVLPLMGDTARETVGPPPFRRRSLLCRH
jgi:hypothetical protein